MEDKTSKEYAEERAREYQSSFYEDKDSDGFKNGVSDYTEGYLDAIEQTQVEEKEQEIYRLNVSLATKKLTSQNELYAKDKALKEMKEALRKILLLDYNNAGTNGCAHDANKIAEKAIETYSKLK